MRERPEDCDDRAVRQALTAWDAETVSLAHTPAGFGDHHWTATDTLGRRWFVTVTDLTAKSHYGSSPTPTGHGRASPASCNDSPGMRTPRTAG
ncbi:hypothetical protein [Thermomonospora cellulosilytica]|uniref:Uncharacterized protein n=1 Tax=Thermomonospora cellulosilytica TaxID=1411118 RepID=A0A7W3MZZ6_9ACTN|nr:hypothetical protein [Thermomonospora cellulosilytica]MBA9004988.1 hypothetical protein [Thermomonospora cellulosilytica]